MGNELPEGFPDMGDLPDGVTLAGAGDASEVLMVLMDLAGPSETVTALVSKTAAMAFDHVVNCPKPECPYKDNPEKAYNEVFEHLAEAITISKNLLQEGYLEKVESARFEKEVSSYLDTIEVAEPDRPEPTDPAA